MIKDKQLEYTTKTEVICDGTQVGAVLLNNNLKTLGHPKIYLKFTPLENKVVCPYCSKIFIYKNNTNS